MNIENLENGLVMIGFTKEELEDSIAGLTQLKPVLQANVIKANGKNKIQAQKDSVELGKHFDTAIMAMTMLLAGFEEDTEGEDNHDSEKRKI